MIRLHESDGTRTTTHTIACRGETDWQMATGPAGDVAVAGSFSNLAALDQGPLVGSAMVLARIHAP